MNPAVPLLLALVLGGLLAYRCRPRWELGLPWAGCGLAAMVLLAPALVLPDGVPSPAAGLEQHSPWRGLDEPELAPSLGSDRAPRGNPHLRDISQQVQPWLLYLRAELRAGRLPYWNPHQLSGTPFWANGSSAPLFPFHLLFAVLPVQLGLVLLPWLRLVVGGCGAWALARELGTSRPAALAAAVVFPLSGTITGFVLFPMANAHALVPWVLLATERLASGRWGFAPLALFGGLQLAAGHPETAVFTGMLTLIYLAVRGVAGGRAALAGAWLRFAGAWTAAAAVSAVHTLPLGLTLLGSSKWLETALPEPVPLPVLGGLALRFVLPELHGNPALGTWWGPYNYPATAIYAGAAALPLAAAALAGIGRDRRWLGVAASTLFALLAAYQVFGVRHLLMALPVIQKSLTHYLKLGVALGLALLAARGLDRLRSGEARGWLAAGSGLVACALAAAWLAFAGPWREHGLLAVQAAWTAGAAAVAAALVVVSRVPAGARRRLAMALPGLLAADLVLAHAWTNPGLSAARLYPETGAVRFLAERPGGGPALGSDRLAGVGTALQPNAAMVYGLHDVRGDTPVKLHHYQEVYAAFASPHPVYFRPIEDWASPWLDRLGVRWVVGAPGAPAPLATGTVAWRLAHDGPDARVWERPAALPLVRWGEGEAGGRLEALSRAPGRWLVGWESPEPATLVVAETWDPGWRARLDGEPAPVEAVDGVLLGVRVGPGAGRLALAYRPAGLAWGTALTLLGLAACAAGLRSGSPVRSVRLVASRSPFLEKSGKHPSDPASPRPHHEGVTKGDQP